MTPTPTTPEAALAAATTACLDNSTWTVDAVIAALRASGWDVLPSTEIERLRGVIQNKDQTIGTVMAEIDRLLADIAALRRVADAAWGLRCTEDGDGDKLWAALDALPDQQVQP